MKPRIWRLPNGVWALLMPGWKQPAQYTNWERAITMCGLFCMARKQLTGAPYVTIRN